MLGANSSKSALSLDLVVTDFPPPDRDWETGSVVPFISGMTV